MSPRPPGGGGGGGRGGGAAGGRRGRRGVRPQPLGHEPGEEDGRDLPSRPLVEGDAHGAVQVHPGGALGDADGDPRWEGGRVVVPGLAEMPLVPASGPFSRWFADRLWRLRALTGLVPSDEMSAQWSAQWSAK